MAKGGIWCCINNLKCKVVLALFYHSLALPPKFCKLFLYEELLWYLSKFKRYTQNLNNVTYNCKSTEST